MYGPKGRARAHLALIGVVLLFVGALALPFLLQQEIVQMGRGPGGDGVRVQSGVRGSLDLGSAAGLPDVSIGTPEESDTAAFLVRWSGLGGAPSEPYTFHMQVQVDDGAWQDWFHAVPAHAPQEAVFSGTPGAAHAFRGRACDVEGTCAEWSTPTLPTHVAPGAYPLAPRLSLALVEPAADATLTGRVAIAWDAEHRDASAPLVDVHAVGPDGTPVGLYSGRAASTVWDTTPFADGAYTLHVRLVDGVHAVEETRTVTVANDAVPLGGGAQDAREGPMPAALPLLALAVVYALRVRRAAA